MIAPDSVVTRAPGLVECAVGAEVIVMSAPAGLYFTMEGTAAAIWTALEQPRAFGALCDELAARFDVDADRCAREVAAYVEDLARDALLHVTPAAE